LKNKAKKIKVLLLLFLAVTNMLSSQHSNKSLKVVIDENAIDVTIPNTWEEITSTFPHYWVKEYRSKDPLLNCYLKLPNIE